MKDGVAIILKVLISSNGIGLNPKGQIGRRSIGPEPAQEIWFDKLFALSR
jgi:hypothetical protein